MSQSLFTRADPVAGYSDPHMTRQTIPGGQVEPGVQESSGGARPTPESTDAQPRPEETYATGAALLRLLVGAALVGAEEMEYRLRAWDARARFAAEEPTYSEPGAPARASWGYAPIGMLFDAGERVMRGYRGWRTKMRRMVDEAWLDTDDALLNGDEAFMPLTEVWMLLDDALASMESAVERWSARGKAEAVRGRYMARHGADSVVDDLLEYVAHNPELRRIIEEQATDVAGSAMDEARDRSAAADQWIERFAHSLLRRPIAGAPSPPPISAAPGAATSVDQTVNETAILTHAQNAQNAPHFSE